MKSYAKLFFILTVFFSVSCSNELDLHSRSAVSAGTELTEKDVETFLIGVYNSVQNDPRRESYILGDLLGGDLNSGGSTNGGGTNAFISNILRPEHSAVNNTWSGYFAALYQVNTLLQSLELLPMDERLEEVKATAHYFRGYLYYNLVTKYGGVPILPENTLEKPSRNSEAEVWQFVEEELEAAIAGAPSFGQGLGGDFYFVSSEAATALMARVKLAQGKMDEAASLAEQLITSPIFKLDDFNKIFRKQDNSEVIFAFENLTEESSITLSTLFYTYAHPQSGSYVYKPNPAAMNMFESGDLRAGISVDIYEGLNVVNKYYSGQTGTDPVIISRLGELYLISAEAQGLQGINRLNELREARGLGPVNASSEDEYLNLILEERRRELFAEGFRWYDLVRTGKAQSVIGIMDRETLLPLPETELLLNENLTQNPGY
ncbi:RagB/SusD family nutrient uptake outer membrane protein [Sinomicrobium weinanense]|uniref:RagB/SusD family nutrient uptake outer membrane protein n=1 Tax=Sinomicrobium weinanense TaxID=2842200 RepID=A0A926JTU6_9FLAO|nr:RagB/SusD family nutrient uptake outer membrane protein [Sinomicrobium weinanense]MBC9797430.1 RagB/SusD family nutrient uptake outer membrane protein [Sinomicrobium weinanense]MBU3123076.1 RagB/SusD family nutrient uptake outer membrane protein [Sinomicrobium weinanense]